MRIWKQAQIQHTAEGVAKGNAADLCGSKRRIREQARGGRTNLAFDLVAAASLNQDSRRETVPKSRAEFRDCA